jgi:type II secretion system protein G
MANKWKMENGRWKFQRAFTLVELLVVISIIGILATLITANLNSARSRARDAQRKSDLKNMSTALRLYYNDRGVFPVKDASYQIMGCTSYDSPASCVWGTEWSVGSGTEKTIYMSILPKDPLSPSQDYRYEPGATGDTFVLSACLENSSDNQGLAASEISCTSNWMFQIKQQ